MSARRTDTLAAQQDWLVSAITGRAPTARARAKNLGGSQVPTDLGLGIYRHGYRARLEECLADDFPALRALLGSDGFARLATAVIAAAPSTCRTLNHYSARLPRLLRRQPGLVSPVPGRLAWDLARVEWARVTAIHAPLAPRLAVATVAAVPPTEWERLSLVPQPSLSLVASPWEVATCLRWNDGDVADGPRLPPRCSCVVAVVRHDDGLSHHVESAAAGRLLQRLRHGLPLGPALAASGLAADEIQAAFARWLAAGLFTDVRRPS